MLIECAALPFLDLTAATLREGDNCHPELAVRLTVRAGSVAAGDVLGAPLRCSAPAAGGVHPLFDGIITEVRINGSACRLKAHGPTIRRDLVPRWRSFGASPRPQPIHQIEQLRPLLEGVDGSERLNRPVQHLFQRGTDWRFLVRLARLSGEVLRYRGGRIRVSGGAPEPVRRLTAAEVREVETTVRLGCPDVEAAAWDVARGVIPQQRARGRAPDGLRLLNLDRLRPAAGPAPAEFLDAFAPPLADAADRLLRARLAGCYRWRGQLVDPLVVNGDRLQPPGVGEPLLVHRRTLRYRHGDGSDQLLNEVVCGAAALGPRLADEPPEPPFVQVGQVVRSDDPERRARVLVRFPWHPAGEGVWCLTPQACAGFDDAGRVHGSLNGPQTFDWVVVLLGASEIGPPLVLTAVYRGERLPPAADPARERVLLRLGDLTVTLRAGPPATLDVTGPEGCFKVQTQTIDLSGEARLHGSLDVD